MPHSAESIFSLAIQMFKILFRIQYVGKFNYV
jgi:hypothetical protein